MDIHNVYMKRCLELASSALGSTAPNPMVGSVIVHENKIIGEGYHMRCGEPHAEVNAINSVKSKELLEKSTLYVNLEPCTHTGKTPPCSDLIISMKIPEVIIGTSDPNPVVNGKGIEKLRKNGVSVTSEILKEECYELNKRFFTFHLKKRPYIILKWAQTKDGFIDIIRNPETPVQPNWISNEYSRMLVHKWRSEEQSVIVGTDTAIFDNPKLTTREWPGKNPLRILIDRDLRVNPSSHLFDNKTETLIINSSISKDNEKTIYRHFDFSNNNILVQTLDYLYEKNIQSLFVEGGRKLIESFISCNLWDEARIFTGNKIFSSGVKTPVIEGFPVEKMNIGNDTFTIFRNKTIQI